MSTEATAGTFLGFFKGWVPIIVIVCSMATTGLGTAWWMGKSFQSYRVEMRDLKKELEGLKVDVTADRYTLTAASEKALRTAIENPGMRVPDPREPSKIIMVRDAVSP